VAVKKVRLCRPHFCASIGASFKVLKRHISTDQQMTPAEYRAKWELPATYPMVALEGAATRSQFAKDNGLGRKVADSEVAASPPPKKRGPPKKS
jgi:predicted transcriptional regulator